MKLNLRVHCETVWHSARKERFGKF